MGEIVKPKQFHQRPTPELKAKVVVDTALEKSREGDRRAVLLAIKERVEGLLNG